MPPARVPFTSAHALNGAAHAFAPSARPPIRPARTIGEGARVATADAHTISAAARSTSTPSRASFATAHALNFVLREMKCTRKCTGDYIPLWSHDPAHRTFGHDYIRPQLHFPVPFTRQEPMCSRGIVAQ